MERAPMVEIEIAMECRKSNSGGQTEEFRWSGETIIVFVCIIMKEKRKIEAHFIRKMEAGRQEGSELGMEES